jgi:glycerophosphoryl diester phosphodiesterase
VIEAVRIAKRALDDLRASWRRLLAVEVLYTLATFALLAPLASLALRGVIRMSGQAALSDLDILHFALRPVGIGALVLLGGLALAIAALQQACLMAIALGATGGQTVSVRAALVHGTRHALEILRVAIRVAGTVLLIGAPFAAAAGLTYLGLLTEFDINFYLTERPPAFWRAVAVVTVLGLGLALALVPRLASWVYALPVLLFEQAGARAALAESRRRSAGHRWTVIHLFGVWLVATSLAGALALGAVGGLGRLIVPLIGESVPVLVLALGALVVLWGLTNFLIGFFQASSFALLVVRLYNAHGGGGGSSARALELLAREKAPRPGMPFSMPGLWTALVVITTVAAGIGVYFLRSTRVEDDVVIIAHRGASNYAPENTLAAMERALRDRADFLEIDVQESADGEVVVIHDVDLMKVGRSPLRVWQAAAADLRAVDVGSWFGPEFSDQRIPTLREVLELARGRGKVNIELKYYGFEDRLEERMVDIVEAAEMADQVEVMSLKASGIRTVRALRPGWTVGLLAATAVGDLTRADVDFLAVNAGLARRSFFRSAHRRGKAVYVWTVNDPVDMWHFISAGADGLITDDPALARQVLEHRAELGSAERLLVSLALFLGNPLEPPSAPDEA